MASAPIRSHSALQARLHQAERALKAARARNQRARAALLGSTGAGAAARRMVVELGDREVRQAAADLTAAAEALAAVDQRQIPLLTVVVAAPRQTEPVRVVQVAQPIPPEGPEGAGPLFAWAREHGAVAC